MCLSKVTATYDQPSALIVDGWKAFGNRDREGFLTFQIQNGKADLDKWIRATGPTIKANDGKTYQAGFHVYAEKPGYCHAMRRVYVRGVTATGAQQANGDCLIAQEMYVPSDPDGWPPIETGADTGVDTAAPVPTVSAPKKKLIDRMWGKGGAR